MKPGYSPDDEYGPTAEQPARRPRPVRDWMCLVVAHQTYANREGHSTIFHTKMPQGVMAQFHETPELQPSALPEGTLLHVRNDNFGRIKSREEILQITPPYEARITRKLGKGNWRAENTTSGEVFEFAETSDRFAVAGPDWPKVGAEITYHQSPTEKFAIMAKQKPYMLVSSGRYNMSLPHDASLPSPEEIDRMDRSARPRSQGGVSYVFGMLLFAGITAAAPAIERVGRAVGLITHRYEPRHGFYLPDGYGMKPE